MDCRYQYNCVQSHVRVRTIMSHPICCRRDHCDFLRRRWADRYNRFGQLAEVEIKSRSISLVHKSLSLTSHPPHNDVSSATVTAIDKPASSFELIRNTWSQNPHMVDRVFTLPSNDLEGFGGHRSCDSQTKRSCRNLIGTGSSWQGTTETD